MFGDMPRVRRKARTFAALAAGVLAAAMSIMSITGTATAADTGSVGGDRTEVTTHGNLTITDAVVGPAVGFNGDTVTFRTTVSATEGTGEVTSFFDQGLQPSTADHLTFRSGTVTYTDPTGQRVTIPAVHGGQDPNYTLSPLATLLGPWQLNAATGATVVYESTFVFSNGRCFSCMFGPGDLDDVRHWVGVKATGLDMVHVSGPRVTCLLGCIGFQ
ncbi:hypothetical protein [Rhodococcus gannanensis]|uniref:Uncharacterized protein n=1 Tax=Rhodococcus gannanensis TaxID=1960308 RepID=A0ABW4P4L1_9NOCA